MTTYRERHLAGVHTAEGARPQPDAEPSLDDMTKAELLDHARSLGATPANEAMTKQELRDSIDASLSE